MDALIRSSCPPPSKEQGRLSSSARSLPSLHFHPDVVPFDEALRDVTTIKRIPHGPELGPFDPVARHGAQFLEIKSMERKGKARDMQGLESNCLITLSRSWKGSEKSRMSSGKGAVVSYSCQDAVRGWVMASVGSTVGRVGV